jgi:hypothetical protein
VAGFDDQIGGIETGAHETGVDGMDAVGSGHAVLVAG